MKFKNKILENEERKRIMKRWNWQREKGERQTDRQTETQIHRDRETETERQKHRDREKERKTESDRQANMQ